jgi:hypothetical protein
VIPKTLAICIVKMYRYLISPLTPASCRFIPTCSEYSITAFKKFGFFKGLKLTIKRIIRCRPGGGYGYDPVPESYPTPNKIKNRRGDLK